MVKIISINFVGFRINISPESLALYIKKVCATPHDLRRIVFIHTVLAIINSSVSYSLFRTFLIRLQN